MGSRKLQSAPAGSWAKAFWLSLTAIGLILSLASYHADDPSFSTFSSTWHAPKNVLGYLGSWSADVFFQLFGYSAWFWPTLLVTALIRWLLKSEREENEILGLRYWIGLGLACSAACLFVDLTGLGALPKVDAGATTNAAANALAAFPPQGMMGIALAAIFKPFLGAVGSYVGVLVLAWVFCLVWWESLPGHVFRAFAAVGLWLHERFGDRFKNFRMPSFEMLKRKREEKPSVQERLAKMKIEEEEDEPAVASAADDSDDEDEEDDEVPRRVPVIREAAAASAKPARERRASPPRPEGPVNWELPPLSLLEAPKKKVKPLTRDQLHQIAGKITSALHSFEIQGEITEVSPGPIITMYEFQPEPGVRVQKILSASTDLAMALGVPSVRIVAPIPGKSVAGIEVPNPDKEEIVLRDVFEQTTERAKSMKLPLVLGKDGEGKPVTEDLSRMPHLLIGGATSMGKSVLVNSILTGLLCRFTPEELRLIIVDPKLVEFKAFEDIPHLMLPIVNDPNDASQALRWAVGETKRRYMLMQKIAAKNIDGYNQKIASLKDEDLKDGEERPKPFSFIVIIIDELAELMLTGKKDVEQSIVRLSQLARAAGIHLIMSTQRPSADVVTGLIKSNCPSRVALRVASASDSRIVLDCAGAEQLLGKGDMFFTNTGPMGLRRMQGSYVSDGEIEKICDFWRGQGEPEYKDEILAPEEEESDKETMSAEGTDALYAEVIEFAKEKGKISTSLIQRRFQIGYTRAARIMEQLEERGVVGEATVAGKPRDVNF